MRLLSTILNSATGHKTIRPSLRANRIIQLRIRSPEPMSQEVRTMIHMLHISKHIIKSIPPHMNIMPPSQKIETMHQVLAQRSPIETLSIMTNLIIVLHLPCHALVIVVNKRLAAVESRKLLGIVMRAILMQPACRQRVVLAAQRRSFRGGVAAGEDCPRRGEETLALAVQIEGTRGWRG